MLSQIRVLLRVVSSGFLVSLTLVAVFDCHKCVVLANKGVLREVFEEISLLDLVYVLEKLFGGWRLSGSWDFGSDFDGVVCGG